MLRGGALGHCFSRQGPPAGCGKGCEGINQYRLDGGRRGWELIHLHCREDREYVSLSPVVRDHTPDNQAGITFLLRKSTNAGVPLMPKRFPSSGLSSTSTKAWTTHGLASRCCSAKARHSCWSLASSVDPK